MSLRVMKMVNQKYSANRYYYYDGSLSARRGEAAMGCPGAMI